MFHRFRYKWENRIINVLLGVEGEGDLELVS
jgi:hypothetical protein